jgi:hypothetical protein
MDIVTQLTDWQCCLGNKAWKMELKIFSKLEDYTSCLVVLRDRGVFKMEQLTWNLNNGNVSWKLEIGNKWTSEKKDTMPSFTWWRQPRRLAFEEVLHQVDLEYSIVPDMAGVKNPTRTWRCLPLTNTLRPWPRQIFCAMSVMSWRANHRNWPFYPIPKLMIRRVGVIMNYFPRCVRVNSVMELWNLVKLRIVWKMLNYS